MPPSEEKEMKWQRLLMRIAAVSALTALVFDFVSILYIFPDSSLLTYVEPRTYTDPFIGFMVDLFLGSILFILLSLIVAPAFIVGGSLFLFEELKVGFNLLISGLAL